MSLAVLQAQGSVLTNKYAEGYPGKRYYGGCEAVDIAEEIALTRVKTLFNCAYVNVQPHSGAQANQPVFMALLQPGDTFMGMDLSAGGHLTHGSPVKLSGKWFHAVTYGLTPDTHLIDYEQVEKLAKEHKPKLIIAGGSAYARVIDFKRFREIADSVGALFMVDMAHFAGLVAGGVYLGLEAFKKTKQYQEGKPIHGLTPTQRYFLGYNLAWLGQTRDKSLRNQILSDVHSPAKYRVNGPFANMEEF